MAAINEMDTFSTIGGSNERNESKPQKRRSLLRESSTCTCSITNRTTFSASIVSDVSTQQDEINERIDRIAESVERLAEITEKQVEISKAAEQAAIATTDAYDRSTVRLDGIEVYTVVSALTVASSIACLDAYGDINTTGSIQVGSILDYVFLLSNTVGVLSGLHSTLIFSLATMYGRTAIGLGRDSSFHTFFAKTGPQRHRGFQTFLWSLYAFVIQCVMVMTNRISIIPEANVPLKYAVLMILLICTEPIFRDTHSIINEAKVIFDPRHFSEQRGDQRSKAKSCRDMSLYRWWNKEKTIY